MKLYRVTNEMWAGVFNGRGASFNDGARWNSAGMPVIYFGTNMATALIEAANYQPSPRLIPSSHCKATYEIADTPIISLNPKLLPDNWQEMPYPESTQIIGDDFLRSKKALMLLVPSVGVGDEENQIAIVNPLHPDINKINLIKTVKPVYSNRMFAGLS